MLKKGLFLLMACGVFTVNGNEADKLAAHILEVRGEPLREISVQREIHVRDFGAVAEEGHNNYGAVQAALAEAAKTGGHVKILFEPGRYEVDPGNGPYQRRETPLFPVKRMKNLVVDGQGAEIVIRRPSIGFCRIENSERILFRNFIVDYDPLPFSQGTLVEINEEEGWFDVETDAGFPALDDPFFETYNSWGMLKDPEFPGKLKDGAPNVFFRERCERIGEGRFRIHLAGETVDSAKGSYAIGDRYAQVGRASGGCEYFNSSHVTFENLTFHAVPGSLFVGSGTSYLNVLGCRARLRGTRLLTSGADGVHVQGARVGPWVEGCEFEGLSDDCLNVYSIPHYVMEVLSPTRLRMDSRSSLLREGDRLAFFHPPEGTVLVETRILSVDGDIVNLEHPVPELNLAPPGTPFEKRGWKIYDHAYNLDATGNYFVYRDNYMHDGRRFGAYIKASYGLIENNRFERLSDSVLCIQNTANWPEGFWSRNLVIRNNQMIDCTFLESWRVAVDADWLKLGYRSAGLAMHQNLFFEGNRVRVRSGPAARFNCVDGLTLTGNTFESGAHEGPLVTGAFSKVSKNENNTPDIEFE